MVSGLYHLSHLVKPRICKSDECSALWPDFMMIDITVLSNAESSHVESLCMIALILSHLMYTSLTAGTAG